MAKESGPKDITPNPLEQVEAKGGAKTTEKVVELPREKTEAEIALEKKNDLQNSLMWHKVLQFMIVVLGLYGIGLGTQTEVFLPVAAVLGALALAGAVLFDVYLCKKFYTDKKKAELNLRYIFATVFVVLGAIFALEGFKVFASTANQTILTAGMIAVAVLFIADFIIYFIKNKKKAIANLFMFIAAVLVFIAFMVFRYFYVIPAMIMAILSILLMMNSLRRAPIKEDDSMKTTLVVIILLLFLPIAWYGTTIFTAPRIQPLEYTAISPAYNNIPENLAWGPDNKTFVYTVYDDKNRRAKVCILNALTVGGVTELPNELDKTLVMPRIVDAPFWNLDSNFLILSAGDEQTGMRKIWGIGMDVAKIRTGKEHIETKTPEEKPKLLLATIDNIVDKDCMQLNHKTAWAPDGKRFVFSGMKGEAMNLWVSDIDKQEIKPITEGERKFMPLWDPIDEKILYVTKKDSYIYIRISEFDGTHAHELNAFRDKDLFPLWSAAEKYVIYIKNDKFIIMKSNATDKKALSKETLTNTPFWLTASKKKVILDFAESGNIWRIWTIDTDGKFPKNIFTQTAESITQPVWSYDGEAIAVAVNYGKYSAGESSVWRMGKDGELPERIYTAKSPITYMEWAPTSKKLAFVVKKLFTHELWVIDKDGSKPLKLYTSFGELGEITWDNDGKRIAFDEKFKFFIFINPLTTVKVVHAYDGTLWSLLPYNFYSKYPSWSKKGDMISYIGWTDYWLPTNGYKVWVARLQ